MAFARSAVVVLIIITAIGYVHGEGPDRFHVGDEQGWCVPDPDHADFYNLWSGRIRFRVGDSLYFQYTNDSVLVVDKKGYYHCNTTDPIAAFDDGETIYPLDNPGLFYFISGEPDHCKNGQRLIVDVMTLHPPRQAPYFAPPPPPPSVVPPVAPAPTPRPSGAAGLAAWGLGAVVAPVLLIVGL